MPTTPPAWIARCLLVVAAGLAWAAPANGDVIETRDGRRLEGAVHFAGGFVYVRSAEGVAKLEIKELRSLWRDGGAEKSVRDTRERGLMAEYFADNELRESCAVLLEPDTSFDWGAGSPNEYTPSMFSVRYTGLLTPPVTGTYRFQATGLTRVQIGDRVLGVDRQADLRGFELEGEKPIPIVLEFRKQKQEHVRAGLAWFGEGLEGISAISAMYLTPPPEFIERMRQFRTRHLPGSAGGLKGEYFADAEMKKRVFVRLDHMISMDWAKPAALSPQFTDKFAARWTGKIRAPRTMTAKFSVNNNARLKIGTTTVIDAWPGPDGKSKGPREGQIDMEAGKLYDFTLELLAGPGWGSIVPKCNFQFDWMHHIPTQFLYPPDDMPRADILLPLQGADLDATDGIEVEVIATAGRGSIRKVEVLSGDEVIAEAKQAPYKLTIHPTVAGELGLTARVTNSAGFVATSPTVKVSVNNTPSELLGGRGWGIGRVGAAEAPVVKEVDGRLELTGSAGSFGEKSSLPLVSRLMAGDGEIVARVAELRCEDPDAVVLAGVTLRRHMRTNAPHITVLASRASGWYIAQPFRGRNHSYLEKPIPAPAWLRIVRTGPIVTASWSADGENWTTAGSVVLGDDLPLIAGITALTLSGNQPVTAVFDHITVRSSQVTQLTSAPGVQLVGGSIVSGTVEVQERRITVRDADGRTRSFPRAQVARIFYGPLQASLAAQLPPGWRGAIVGNDLFEGELTDISGDGATVNSIIFGIRRLTRANGLAAVILGDVDYPRDAVRIVHTGGQAVVTRLHLDADRLVVTDPALGELRLAITDLSLIQPAR